MPSLIARSGRPAARQKVEDLVLQGVKFRFERLDRRSAGHRSCLHGSGKSERRVVASGLSWGPAEAILTV